MTTLRFKHEFDHFSNCHCVRPYPESAQWVFEHIPLGNTFELETIEDRSNEHHRWLFAVVKKVFENLPEVHAEQFKNPEHLRKRALIEAGWCRHIKMHADDAPEIMRLCIWLDPYMLISAGLHGVNIYQAKSMRMKRNGGELTKEKFKEVVERMLHYMAGLIGLDPAELLREIPDDLR